MKKYSLPILLCCLPLIAADASGGDILMHDLQPLPNKIMIPDSDSEEAGCGEPPDGYFIWFDGDDIYAGGAPTATVSWTDKGREGRKMDQDTAGHRPTINEGYLTFDGTNDFLKAQPDSNWSELFSSSSHFCNLLVRNNSHADTKQTIFSTYSTSTVGRPNFNIITDLMGLQQEYYINNGAGQHMKRETTFAEPLNTWYNYKTEYDRAGLQARTGNDANWGTYTAANNAAGTAPIASYYTYAIGAISAGVTYASDTSSQWNWSGDIAQIICYTDLTKETDVETWIDCKKDEL